VLLAAYAARCVTAPALAAAQPSTTAQTLVTSRATAGNELASDDGLYPHWLDRGVSPAVDFFSFANGGWIKSHPIPADRSYWGVDTVVERDNQTFIRAMLESLAAGSLAPGTDERKIADFYVSGMDESAIDAAGIGPLTPELQRVEAITAVPGLLREFDHLQMLGVDTPWQIGQMQDFNDSTRVIAVVSQGGLGLPNRDYYLSSLPTFVRARAAYVQHIARMLVLLGESRADAERHGKAVMVLETRLAKASMSDVEQRDPRAVYHVMTLGAADALTRRLRWRDSFASIGHPALETVNIGMPEFVTAVDREIVRTPLETWKAYLRWQITDSFAAYLSKPFVDEQFRMTQVLTGAEQLQPRWLRVLRAEDEAMGFALGKLYVERRFPPAAKAAAMTLVLKVRDALCEDLASLAWMTPATRAAALKKLDLMELRVGYPDQWRDYSGLTIDRGLYVLNVMRAREFEQRRQFAKIGQPVDRSEWGMTPQTVNAYYDPSLNSLNIPAGILQPPYFEVDWPDAANYGATGATVGHEMTHGFDDEGAQFDGHGNLVDWWAPADLAKFREATQCISQQFSQLTVAGGLHVQGNLVTGEATADLGGLILAWRALQSLPKRAQPSPSEWTPDQRFFIAYAHSWAGAVRPEQAQELVTTDPHPPADYRTNATLANMPAFQSTFTIGPQSPMVKLPRCVIW
jgi:putative endopeptidase